MTSKTDFASEEWNTLLQAPANTATYVITADMSVMGALKEMKALGKAVEKPSAPEAAQELVSALVTDRSGAMIYRKGRQLYPRNKSNSYGRCTAYSKLGQSRCWLRTKARKHHAQQKWPGRKGAC